MKPEDITDEAWNAAGRFCSDTAARLPGAVSVEEFVARAIMAAKAEEREACAKLIEEGFDREGVQSKNDKCPHGLYGWEDCEQCAVRAIRKRGDTA
jgi:hypothetical protein